VLSWSIGITLPLPWAFTYRYTNFMEQSPPWESDSFSVNKLPSLVWKPMVHYNIHKGSLLVHILNHKNPAHIFSHFVRKIHFNIILRPTTTFSERFLPFRFFDQTFIWISRSPSHACYMPLPSHPPWFDRLITFDEAKNLHRDVQ